MKSNYTLGVDNIQRAAKVYYYRFATNMGMQSTILCNNKTNIITKQRCNKIY